MEIIDIKKEIPMADFIGKYVDTERFLKSCSECRGYGRTWACPPYDFDPASIWKSHQSVLIRAKKVLIPEEDRAKRMTNEELNRYSHELLLPVKRELMDELYAMEAEAQGSLALSAGGCDICSQCTRPEGGACRFPEKLRFSVESLGGDVILTCQRLLGEEVLWAENGMLPDHFLIVGALLK